MGSVGSVAASTGTLRGVPAHHAVADFRLACVSRAIDDREMALQKQSRVFFQISGAGHEALLLSLARHLRPGYDWFFPYYRDLALVLGLGVTPEDVLLQAVGSADDPASGGRQMPAHWGSVERNIVTQSSCTGSQVLHAVGSAEAARYISRRPHLPGCAAQGDELTYVSLGDGATSEGEFWSKRYKPGWRPSPGSTCSRDSGRSRRSRTSSPRWSPTSPPSIQRATPRQPR
jgi:2-oxoisovalerate dehydrogenase E1 component